MHMSQCVVWRSVPRLLWSDAIAMPMLRLSSIVIHILAVATVSN